MQSGPDRHHLVNRHPPLESDFNIELHECLYEIDDHLEGSIADFIPTLQSFYNNFYSPISPYTHSLQQELHPLNTPITPFIPTIPKENPNTIPLVGRQ